MKNRTIDECLRVIGRYGLLSQTRLETMLDSDCREVFKLLKSAGNLSEDDLIELCEKGQYRQPLALSLYKLMEAGTIVKEGNLYSINTAGVLRINRITAELSGRTPFTFSNN